MVVGKVKFLNILIILGSLCSYANAARVAKVAKPAKPAKSNGMNCMTKCHSDFRKLSKLHPTIKQKGCLVCHKEGKSDVEFPDGHLQIAAFDEEKINDMCFVCHRNIQKQAKTLKEVHPPFTDNTCITCHDPHGT